MPWQVLFLLEKVCFHLEVKTTPNLMLTSPKPIFIQSNFRNKRHLQVKTAEPNYCESTNPTHALLCFTQLVKKADR